MSQIQFDKPSKVHFIGIGGISMSGLAEILIDRGFTVTGSDNHKNQMTQHLEQMGAVIHEGQKAENITDDIDLVVYTAAIHPDNPEFIAAREHGIPMIDRAQLLGEIMRHYPESIAISGTHGKTTTTSMISEILLAASYDPTISVGGVLKSINGNIRLGQSPYFITEACEYTNSFLKLDPKVEIILNIEEDHLDFFKDIDDIRHSFTVFAHKLPQDGTLIINGSIDHLSEITDGLNCKILTFGLEPENNYSATHIKFDENARGSYDLMIDGNYVDHIHLNVSGIHNVSNSLAAIAAAQTFGASMKAIKQGLLNFAGTDRRFENKGSFNGVTVIDDYAHHPTEIAATLRTAQNYPHKTLWCVFQPHTYSRTKAFYKEMAKSLSLADKIILTDIFAAREKDPGDIHSKDIQKLLLDAGKEAYYFPTFEEIENFLRQNCESGDVVITMGAGDVVKIGEDLLA